MNRIRPCCTRRVPNSVQPIATLAMHTQRWNEMQRTALRQGTVGRAIRLFLRDVRD